MSKLTLLQATAPRNIWLQISDDADHHAESFPKDWRHNDSITWCADSVTACQVGYVREDLAAAPAGGAEAQDDYEVRPLYAAPTAQPQPTTAFMRAAANVQHALFHDGPGDAVMALRDQIMPLLAGALEECGYLPDLQRAAPTLLNGLTEQETAASASVAGLGGAQPEAPWTDPLLGRYAKAVERVESAQPEAPAEPSPIVPEALRQEADKLARVLRGMTEVSVAPDDLWEREQPDGDPFVARAAELLNAFAFALQGKTAPVSPSEPDEEAEGLTQEQWIKAAERVFLAVGDEPAFALQQAKYLLRMQDLSECDDPYEAALEDIEGRPTSAAVGWPTMPPSKNQSPALFEDGYAEGWARCLQECKKVAALATSAPSEPAAAAAKLLDDVNSSVETEHPNYGGGFFMTPDVFAAVQDFLGAPQPAPAVPVAAELDPNSDDAAGLAAPDGYWRGHNYAIEMMSDVFKAISFLRFVEKFKAQGGSQ